MNEPVAPRTRRVNPIGCAGGVYTIAGTCLVTILSFIGLTLMASVASDRRNDIEYEAVLAIADLRFWLLPLLALPGIGIGIITLRRKRTGQALVWAAIGTACMLLPAVLAGLAILRLLAPLYSYQDI